MWSSGNCAKSPIGRPSSGCASAAPAPARVRSGSEDHRHAVQPVPPVAPRPRRQCDLAPGVIPVEPSPIDLDAAEIQVGDALDHLLPLSPAEPQRRNRRCLIGTHNLASEAEEDGLRPDLDECLAPELARRSERVRKAHRLAYLPPPVRGVGQQPRSRAASPVTLETSLTRGVAAVTSPATRSNASSIGSISGEWKACDTARRRASARRRPRASRQAPRPRPRRPRRRCSRPVQTAATATSLPKGSSAARTRSSAATPPPSRRRRGAPASDVPARRRDAARPRGRTRPPRRPPRTRRRCAPARRRARCPTTRHSSASATPARTAPAACHCVESSGAAAVVVRVEHSSSERECASSSSSQRSSAARKTGCVSYRAATHAGVLRALTGEQERDLRRLAGHASPASRCRARRSPAGAPCSEPLPGLVGRAGHDREAVRRSARGLFAVKRRRPACPDLERERAS